MAIVSKWQEKTLSYDNILLYNVVFFKQQYSYGVRRWF